jgi:hypothetical protein
LAGAINLQVPDRALGIYSCETGRESSAEIRRSFDHLFLTGSVLEKGVSSNFEAAQRGAECANYPPTLEVASVRLFRVVLFPDEGLPTRPMSGSRGMISDIDCWLASRHLFSPSQDGATSNFYR